MVRSWSKKSKLHRSMCHVLLWPKRITGPSLWQQHSEHHNESKGWIADLGGRGKTRVPELLSSQHISKLLVTVRKGAHIDTIIPLDSGGQLQEN